MEHVIPNFNVGDVLIEYNISLGELTDVRVFLQKSNDRVNITYVLPTSAIEEIREELLNTDRVRNLIELSMENLRS